MSPCSDDALKLDYLNGALSEREGTVFEAHLAACPLCRQEIDELRRTAALVAGLTLPSAPVTWTEATKARLRAKIPPPVGALQAQPPPASKWLNVLQYGGIAVGAVAGLALLFRLIAVGTVARWLPGLPAAALGISEPHAARTVELVTWFLALHALLVVPSIIDDIYLLAQAGSRRRRGLRDGLHRRP